MRYHFKHYKFFLFVFDALLLYFSLYISYFIKFNKFPTQNEFILSYIFILFSLLIFFILDLYNPWSHVSKFPLYYRSILGIFTITILYFIFSFVLSNYKNPILESRAVFLLFVSFITPFIFFSRFIFYNLLDPERLKIKWLVLTKIEYAIEFQREIDHRGGKWEIFYLINEKLNDQLYKEKISNLNILGTIQNDFNKVYITKWTGIIIATNNLTNEQINTLIELKRKGIPIYDLVYFYEYYFFKIPLYYVDDKWFLLIQSFILTENSSILRIKLILDKLISLFFIILLSPIILLVALLVWIDDGFPIFFTQERLGKDKKVFIAYKFRTMIKDADKYNPYTQENDPRITRIGSFLRKTRLDEIPQLFNILKGDMSLIGPRAEWIKLTSKYETVIKFYHFRHLIRPGLTGWAQVMFPYGASIEDTIQKLEYDLYYIKNYSLLLDFSILIKTIRIILFGRGR